MTARTETVDVSCAPVPVPAQLSRAAVVPSPAAANRRKALSIINETTKYGCLAVCSALILGYRSIAIIWAITGSVFSVLVAKILKYVLNHSRPDGAPKKDPGMPSTHATALASLGASACLGILAGPGPAVYRWTAASCLAALSSFLIWLRVELGFHTLEQVVVGAALGCTCAAGWRHAALEWILPACESSPEARTAVYGIFGVLSTAFLVKATQKFLAGEV